MQRSSLFASLTSTQVEALLKGIPTLKFRRQETLVKQGGKSGKVYLLLEGRVGVFTESPTGLKTTLLMHRAPYLFGDIEVMQEKPYLGTVVAIEPCSALCFSKSEFLGLLHANHQVAINFSRLLAGTLYETAYAWRIRMFGQVAHLVANTLCLFAQIYGEEHRYGTLVRKEISKSEIAALIGVARKSVIRAFQQLEAEGLIQMDGRQLIIPDMGGLRAKAAAPFPVA